LPPQKKVKLYSGSRKTARATAAIGPGTGRVRVNNLPVELVQPEVARQRIMTPLVLAGESRGKFNVDVEVKGGGFMGQAEASAIAISRAIVGFLRSSEVKDRISGFDKHLLSGDPRQTEPKKFGGPGARRRRQKSYR
jgi:small subunit ribosomal protein S9